MNVFCPCCPNSCPWAGQRLDLFVKCPCLILERKQESLYTVVCTKHETIVKWHVLNSIYFERKYVKENEQMVLDPLVSSFWPKWLIALWLHPITMLLPWCFLLFFRNYYCHAISKKYKKWTRNVQNGLLTNII